MKKKLLSFLIILPLMLSSCGETGDVSGDHSGQASDVTRKAYTINFDLNDGHSDSYSGSKSIDSFSEDIFFYDCVKEGYNFRGWSYDGVKIFDEKGKQVAEPTLKSEMTFVALYEKNVRLTITMNIPDAGSVKGEGIYAYNSYVDVSATPLGENRFLGWYYQGTLLSTSLEYKYMMWDKDITLEAKFAYPAFHFNVYSNHSEYGLVLVKSEESQKEYSSYYSVDFDYKSKVTVAAYSKTDVRFLGWYDKENNLVSVNAVYDFIMPYEDYALEAKWNYFEITYRLNGGTNSKENPYSYTIDDSTINLSNPTREGYRFVAWKYKDQYVTAINPNWADDIELTALWDAITYSITYHLNGGTNASSNPTSYTVETQTIYLKSPTRKGYTFSGWYTDSYYQNRIYEISKWTVGDLNLYAKWEATEYTITYNLNGGTNSSLNPICYGVDDEIVLLDPTKDGYTFLGWYNGDKKVEKIEKGSMADVTLEAKWSANLYTLSVTSEDTSKGTASIVSGQGYTDEAIIVKAIPSSDYVFKGWYEGTKLVSRDETYSFTMPAGDKSLIACFWTKEDDENEAIKIGKIPNYLSETNTLTYGLYPQTHVSDTSLISTLNTLTTTESNGWYLYNGSYYTKKTASSYSSYKFGDGTEIVDGATYWFKCEPIEWKILSSDNGTYSLVSTVLLDAHRYASSSNNYKESEIRSWLNKDFYNAAFSLDSSYIQKTTVDNSASTTDSSSNYYACENTNDKVYLLSYQDYKNTTYFPDVASRYCKLTDYAKANGAYYYSRSGSSYNGNGYYLTRSPYRHYDSGDAWLVNVDGSLYGGSVSYSRYGVRPAITITI